MRPVIVVVTGLPASGKTTISKKLAEALSLPLFSKDSLKESLFDSLGYSDRAWSKKLGAAAIDLLYRLAEAEIAAGRSVILESNFKPEFDEVRLVRLLSQFGASTIQIICVANGDVLFQRFCDRARMGERHPGHVDAQNLEEFRERLTQGVLHPMNIGSQVIEIDTTDFALVDIAKIIGVLNPLLAQERAG